MLLHYFLNRKANQCDIIASACQAFVQAFAYILTQYISLGHRFCLVQIMSCNFCNILCTGIQNVNRFKTLKLHFCISLSIDSATILNVIVSSKCQIPSERLFGTAIQSICHCCLSALLCFLIKLEAYVKFLWYCYQ